jgi:hypothetical protein
LGGGGHLPATRLNPIYLAGSLSSFSSPEPPSLITQGCVTSTVDALRGALESWPEGDRSKPSSAPLFASPTPMSHHKPSMQRNKLKTRGQKRCPYRRIGHVLFVSAEPQLRAHVLQCGHVGGDRYTQWNALRFRCDIALRLPWQCRTDANHSRQGCVGDNSKGWRPIRTCADFHW